MSGGFVEVKQKPVTKTVDEYDNYLKRNAPNKNAELFTRSKEIKCTCCTQKAPSEAAAMLKVEDQTPFTKKFGTETSPHSRDLGETVWICADCFTNGVRPKYVYFGEMKWNKMGRKVQHRANQQRGHPW